MSKPWQSRFFWLGLVLVAGGWIGSNQEQWGTLAEVEKNEAAINQFQPPGRVLDAIGLKPGMVAGEVGAGAGRYTVFLADRVGRGGKVFANDIDPKGLALIRERCEKYRIRNIETVHGTAEDPGFARGSLDLVFMVYVYHHLDRPVAMMKKLLPALKKGGSVAIITGDPDKGRWTSLPRQDVLRKQFAEAGYELVRTETFLPYDYLFILRPAVPDNASSR